MDTYDLMNNANQSTDPAVIGATKVLQNSENQEIIVSMFQRFVGMECIIYMLGGVQFEATVKEVAPKWMIVKDNTDAENVLNVDYILRIREYPRNKNGKKKAVFV